MGRSRGHARLLACITAAAALCCALPAAASAATINVSRASVNFGATEPGIQTNQNLTFSNPGPGAVTLTNFSINGPNVANFNYNVSDCLQSGVYVIGAGDSCEVPLGFIPGGLGARTAFFRFRSDDPANLNVSIPLAGIGARQAIFGLDKDVFFPSRSVGTTATGHFTSIANNGLVPLDIKSFAIVGFNRAEFTLGPRVCPARLPVASECDANILFTPTSAGAKTAALRVGYGRFGETIDIPIIGTAVGGVGSGVDTTPLLVTAERVKPKKLKKIKNLTFKTKCENANCDAKVKLTITAKLNRTTHKSLVDSKVTRLSEGRTGKLTATISKKLRRKLLQLQGRGAKVSVRAQVVANAVGERRATRTFTIKLK